MKEEKAKLIKMVLKYHIYIKINTNSKDLDQLKAKYDDLLKKYSNIGIDFIN